MEAISIKCEHPDFEVRRSMALLQATQLYATMKHVEFLQAWNMEQHWKKWEEMGQCSKNTG